MTTEDGQNQSNLTNTEMEQIRPVENIPQNEPDCEMSNTNHSQQKSFSTQQRSVEKSAEFKSDNFPLPVLELERYQEHTEQSVELESPAEGSIRFAWIGSGRCGCRILKSFYRLGHKKALAVDTAEEDLDLLDIPPRQKLLMKTGLDAISAGTDTDIGSKAIQLNQQKILQLEKEIFGTGIDHIMICFGAGGSTGAGSVFGLIQAAKRYARHIGLDGPNKCVGVVMTLPACNLGANPSAAKIAYRTATKLGQMASAGKISPLIIIDNNSINKISPVGQTKSLWSGINDKFANLFDTFNRLSAKSSPYTSLDPIEYRSIIDTSGCAIMGVTEVKEIDNPFSISEAVKNNFENPPFLSGFDISTAKQTGCIVIGDKKLLANIKGLQNNIDYAFDVLSEITGNATAHRGIYEDDSDSLKVYTIISGLTGPTLQLQQLHEHQYARPDIADLEGLPLCERKEDIIPLAQYFLESQSQKYNESYKVLSPDAKRLLLYYLWPGDVRQLAEAMERAYCLSADEQIRPADLPFEIIFADYETKDEVETSIINQTRAEIITRALELTGDNRSAAGKILGISGDLLDWYIENMDMPVKKQTAQK